MKYPKVSVIIPSYNRFDNLLIAIESVMNQNYENFEIIIVNDGSTDKRYKEYKFNKKIKLINLKQNQKSINGFGPGAIRNYGTDIANGKYIAFLDDDDIWLENKLSIQIEALESSDLQFSSTEGYFGNGAYDKTKNYSLYNKEHFFEDIKYKYRKTNFIKKGKFPDIWSEDFLKIHNCVITSSVIVERNIYEILGGFRGLPRWADYDCWLGLVKLSSIKYIDEPLFYYDDNHGNGQEYFK